MLERAYLLGENSRKAATDLRQFFKRKFDDFNNFKRFLMFHD